MLTPLIPRGDRSRGPAYRVPWHVERLHESHSLVSNVGATAVDIVRVFVHVSPARPGAVHGSIDHVGPRLPRTPRVETHLWGLMTPGESVELCLCALDPDDCLVTLAWFRPDDGREYVWRFAP
ncbi:MAG: hypothetical protein Q7T17_11875 [Microbacterium sp.]|uniref:hypothetical protein n=1 Tax=Microbacterium sp. TaxID=51671 RepID=UPI00271E6D5C|nr:hypothetical protein [Microbacterium sp.]MDO8383660.1 hypothetical protein [Microbacterium sp.]